MDSNNRRTPGTFACPSSAGKNHPEFRSYNTAWGLAWWLHNYIPTCMLQHVLENTRACDAARRPARPKVTRLQRAAG